MEVKERTLESKEVEVNSKENRYWYNYYLNHKEQYRESNKKYNDKVIGNYLYAFFLGSTCIYVGCTNNVQRRLSQHLSKSDANNLTFKIAEVSSFTESKDELHYLEYLAIKQFKSIANINSVKGKFGIAMPLLEEKFKTIVFNEYHSYKTTSRLEQEKKLRICL